MAQRRPPAAALKRRVILVGKAIFGAALSILAYAWLSGPAIGPGYGSTDAMLLAAAREAGAPTPTLAMQGGKPVITGSVAGLFQSASFLGPNEVMKTNRARISVDVMSLTKTFATARAQMKKLGPQTQVALADTGKKADSTVAQKPALISTPLDSAALAAIDKSVPQAPEPQAVPSQLAYARANTPTTTFEDKPPAPKYSAHQLWCMAEAIYFEARGEPYKGQVAVAQVVMNRVRMSLYPDTICGVVFQDEHVRNACQFSFACDGIPEIVTDKKAWAQAEDIARKVTSGELYLKDVGKASHYHATYVHPDWAPRLKRITRIGQHIFYKFRNAG